MSATPWSASRNAVSWSMTSWSQAIRVVASAPMRMMLPFVPYVPLNELQPAKPPTLASPNATSMSVPAITDVTAPAPLLNAVTCHSPRTGFRGAAS